MVLVAVRFSYRGKFKFLMPKDRTVKSQYASRCSNLRINPYEPNLRMTYPTIFQKAEKAGIGSFITEKLIKYLILCYDPSSPIVKDFSIYKERKTQAALEAGIDEKDVDAKAVVWFLKNIIRSRQWTFISSMERVFDEYTDHVNNPSTSTNEEEVLKAGERKMKILESMGIINDKLVGLYAKMFDSDETLIAASEDEEDFSAESVAKMTKK